MKQVESLLRSVGVLSPKADQYGVMVRARLLVDVHIHHNLILDHLGDDFFFTQITAPVMSASPHRAASPNRSQQYQPNQQKHYASPRYLLKSLKPPSNVLFYIPGEMHFIDQAGDVYVICEATGHLTRIYRSLRNPLRYALVNDQLEERSFNEWRLLSELSSTYNVLTVATAASIPKVDEYPDEASAIVNVNELPYAHDRVRLVKYTDRSCSVIQWETEPYDDLISEDDGIYGYLGNHRERILDPFNTRIDTTAALKAEEKAVYKLLKKYFTGIDMDDDEKVDDDDSEKMRDNDLRNSMSSRNSIKKRPVSVSSTNGTLKSAMKKSTAPSLPMPNSPSTRDRKISISKPAPKDIPLVHFISRRYTIEAKHPEIHYSFDRLEFELTVEDYHFPTRYSAFEVRGDELYGLPVPVKVSRPTNKSFTPPLSPCSTTSDLANTATDSQASPTHSGLRAGVTTVNHGDDTVLMSPLNSTLMQRRKSQLVTLRRIERDRWVRILNGNKESIEMVRIRTKVSFTYFYWVVGLLALVLLLMRMFVLLLILIVLVVSAYRNSTIEVQGMILRDLKQRVDAAVAKDKDVTGEELQYLTSMTQEELVTYLESHTEESNFFAVRVAFIRIPMQLLEPHESEDENHDDPITAKKKQKKFEEDRRNIYVGWIFLFGFCFLSRKKST